MSLVAELTVLIEILIHLFGELAGPRAHCRPAHHPGLGVAHLEIREMLKQFIFIIIILQHWSYLRSSYGRGVVLAGH